MKYYGICLITKKVSTMVDFYKRIFIVNSKGDDNHADLEIGGLNLSIFSEKGMQELAPNSMDKAGSGNLTIEFEVEDVDIEYLRINKLGIQILKQPTSYPWGSRAFWFRDPDGNIIDIFSRL